MSGQLNTRPQDKHSQPHSDPFWKMGDCTSEVSLSRSTLYRLIEKNDFPQPIHVSEKSIRFISSEVIAWKNQRIANSRKGES